MVQYAATKYVRDSYRMNDCMKYWQSAKQIAQTTAKDNSVFFNSQFGRIHNPDVIYYDSFIPAGVATNFPLFIVLPFSWIETTTSYNISVNHPWGIIHEITHHHQQNWGNTLDKGEMTNNAISLAIYAKMNIGSSSREIEGWLRYSYASYMLNDKDKYGLGMYSTMIHFFGVDAFKKFVYSDQNDLHFSKSYYGYAGSEMLKASIACNRNMRYHWNFHLMAIH